MLRATRRLLRPGGRTVFVTIHLPEGLSSRERGRALDVGPSAAATRSPSYLHLLRSAGFVGVEQIDVTDSLRAATDRWLRHAREHEPELAALEPPGDFAARIEEQQAFRTAMDEGLLRRSVFVGFRHASPAET